MNNARMAPIVLIVLVLVGCAGKHQEMLLAQPTPAVEHAVEPNESDAGAQARVLEEEWGIKIEFAVLSAGGYMVDFRFRVLDVAKATPILERQAKPYLVDQATGAVFIVPTPPKIGQLRSGVQIRKGKVYFILFANPTRYIKTGNKVTVVVGDFQARDVIIQ